MAKLTLNNINSGYASNTAINTNNDLIETALEKTLSRDGTSPNYMETNLDLNGYKVINLATPINGNDAARLVDIQSASSGMPIQTGHANQFLKSNGVIASWQVPEAGEIHNIPSGTISTTTVQAALNELDTKKLSLVTAATGGGSSLIGFTQAGTGAVVRTIQDKNRDIVSVFDFMTTAQIEDIKTRTASIDVTAAIQTAIDASYGKTLLFPSGTYRLNSNIKITNSIEILGEGEIDKGISLVTGATSGTIFNVTFGVGTALEVFLVYDVTHLKYFSVSFKHIEFFCTYQPNPAPAWAPITTPWAISIIRDPYVSGPNQCSIENVMIRNFTHGVKNWANSLIIDGLYTQCFVQTLNLDGCYDTAQIRRMHDFIYWTGDTNVHDYMMNNKVFILFGRADNPILDDLFCFTAKNMFLFQDSNVSVAPSGSVSRALFSNVGCDDIGEAFTINSATYKPEITITGGYVYANTLYTGGIPINCSGAGGSIVQISNFDITSAQQAAISLATSAHVMWLSNVKVRSYNQSNAGQTAIKPSATGSVIYTNNVWVDTTQGNGQAATSGSGTINGSIYSPAVTVGAASVTVGASPFTYTAGTTYEFIQVWGGTITGFTIGGVAAANLIATLRPGQSCVITYTVLPSMMKNVL